MKQTYAKLFSGVALTGLLMLASCQSPYKLARIDGSMITIVQYGTYIRIRTLWRCWLRIRLR